jgi:DNA repair exonuclease SbcCD ATPase subunit
LSRADNKRGLGSTAITNVPKENLRDPAILEKFIREYLKDYECTEEIIQKVLDLNKKYSAIVEEAEEIGRNINWQIKSLEWDNLFNYGEKNRIDFESLSGIVGIFGKNFSGKSSIIDSLLFTIFNTTSKNERKNINVINQQKLSASCLAKIVVNTDVFSIQRSLTKYKKKMKSEVVEEAKVELDFTRECTITDTVESMNGVSRVETDHNIRRVFGTIDDFLNTSMSSQLDGLAFVREGSTKRKEIIAKFLDLEIFEKKFRLAKDDSSDLKGALRRLEGRSFDSEIQAAHQELSDSEADLTVMLKKCKLLEQRITEVQSEIRAVEEQIKTSSTEVIDGAELRNLISKRTLYALTTEGGITEKKSMISDKTDLLQKIDFFLQSYDYQGLIVRRENVKTLQNQLSAIESEIKLASSKTSLLDGIPCGTQFPKCKFIRDATEASQTLESKTIEVGVLQDKISEAKPDSIQADLEKYTSIVAKKEELLGEIKNLDFVIERAQFELRKTNDELESLREKELLYEQTKEQIKNAQKLLVNLNRLKISLSDAKRSHNDCTDKLTILHRKIGSAEQKLEMLTNQKDELHSLRTEFSAYELFMRCMHSNGIAYDIIKKQLPVINEEITKILSNLTEFNVFFEEDGDKLDIMIKHVDQDPRPLSMASGAEKTMAAMAIRLALLQVSNLPKSDIMILDEPGTALDENHLQTFTQLLDLLKTQFRTILIVSHLDSLKDVVDTTIEIGNKDGFAFVNQ